MTEATLTFHLEGLNKDSAIAMARHFGLRRDWARVKLPEIRTMLRAFDAERLVAAAKALPDYFDDEDITNLTDPEVEFNDDPDEPGDEIPEGEPIPAKAQEGAPAFPEPAQPATPKAPAMQQPQPAAPDMNQAAALLAQLLSMGKGADPEQVRAIVKAELANVEPREVVVKVGDLEAKKIEGYVRPEFDKVLRRASAGINQLIIGPAGCGKTHLAGQVAEALSRPFASVSCSEGMSESALLGWLLPIGEGGKFEYVPSDFVRMYEEGGVFLFDEIDAADPNVLLLINQALANGHFPIPQRIGNTVAKRHKDFVCIAAANTFGKGGTMVYAGRNQLDEATLDRFRAGQLALDYDEAFEKQAVPTELRAWGHRIRERIAKNAMRRVMSTRFLLDAARDMAAGASFDEIKETFFLGWKDDERSKVHA
jgi:cobaltochelatase CobS